MPTMDGSTPITPFLSRTTDDRLHGLPFAARHQRGLRGAGQGFGTHGHRDMEIISYVLEGELAHKDSMGNGSASVPATCSA